MKPRTLLVLALVVGALVAGVLLFEKDLPSTDERTAQAKKVVPVASADLIGVEIEWQGKSASFVRDAKPDAKSVADESAPAPAREWRMTAPFETAADSSLIDGLVGQLTSLESERDLEDATRADLGLEPARGRVSWKTASASGTLEIGGEIPASADVVVATSVRPSPAVVSKGFVSQLERAPGEWRSREAVPATRAEIEKVTLSVPGSSPVVLARSGETYRLVSPVDDVAEREPVDALMTALSGLRVETFLDPPLTETAATALAIPMATIELVISGREEPFEIALAGEPVPGKRTVRAGTQAFVATTPLFDSVARPVDDWRSRHWTRFETWRIERLTLEDGAGRTVLERRDGQWHRDGVEIGFSAASDLLYALTSARADVLLPSRAATSSEWKPASTIVLADADGNEETLTLGSRGESGTPARVSGRDLTLVLGGAVCDELRSKIGAMRAAVPVGAGPTPPAEPSPAAAAVDDPSPLE